MKAYEKAVAFLPEGIQRTLLCVSGEWQDKIQEIRLRKDGFLILSSREGEYTVDTAGRLSEHPGPRSVYCSGYDLEKTFLKLCDYSVHSHSEEIKEGFVTADGGFRAGIAGTAVLRDGRVTTVRDIRSVSLRVAGRHDGCASALMPLFAERIPSVMIAGEPSAGKTAMLRDIARSLSNGIDGRRYSVCVVDERGEIARAGGLENADVLTAIPKPLGVLQALRTLAPEVILLDELGTLEEVEAIASNLHAGVPAIATAHCRNLEEALKRPAIRHALEAKVFDKIVFLRGRKAPGEIQKIVEVDMLEMGRGGCFDGSRHMHGGVRSLHTTSPQENTAADYHVAARF